MQRTSLHFNPSKYNIRKYKNKWVSCQKKKKFIFWSRNYLWNIRYIQGFRKLSIGMFIILLWIGDFTIQFITTTRWEKLMGMYRIEKWIRSASLYIEHSLRQSNLDRSIFNAKFKSTFCTIIYLWMESRISCPQHCRNSTKRNLKFL